MEQKKPYKMQSYQDGYIFSQVKFPGIVSAWATGKTMCLVMRAIYHSKKYPNNLGVIFRKEFTDLRDSTIKDFELYSGMKVNSSREVKFDNGSLITDSTRHKASRYHQPTAKTSSASKSGAIYPEEAWASTEPVDETGGRNTIESTADSTGISFFLYWVCTLTGVTTLATTLFPS